MKKQKIQVEVYKAKDGYRWRLWRSGRIIGENHQGHARKAYAKNMIQKIIESFNFGRWEFKKS